MTPIAGNGFNVHFSGNYLGGRQANVGYSLNSGHDAWNSSTRGGWWRRVARGIRAARAARGAR